MDTPQTTLPELTRKTATSPARFFLFGGIVLVAIVSVMLAVLLPRQEGDLRQQAWTSAACAGKVTVAPSACNGKCAVDADCTSGMVCYKTSGATEGVCRNSTNVTSTTCTGTSTPTPTPTTACTQTCDLTTPNTCAAGTTCVAPAITYRTTTSVFTSSQATATAAELASIPSSRTIIAYRGGYDVDRDTATGEMKYHIISKVAQTYYVKVYQITGAPPALDPQTLIKSTSLTINANSNALIKIQVPSCGRYQVDFSLASDPGSIALAGDNGYFWGDNQLAFPCPGCCQATTQSGTPSSSMLTNGSFDAGSLTPWSGRQTAGTYALDTSTKQNGVASAKLVTTTAGTNTNLQLRQPVDLVSGKSYTFSFWAKASSARSTWVAAQMPVTPFTTLGSNTFNLTTGWQQYTHTFTAASSQSDANFGFSTGDVAGTVWVDGVTFTQN